MPPILGFQTLVATPSFYVGAEVQTQALMLAQRMFLPTDPSLQPTILFLETGFYVTLAR